MSQKPTTRTAILALIDRDGPLSIPELMVALGKPYPAVRGSIDSARRHGNAILRIVSWRRQEGRGGRISPVYGRGPGRDASRPPLTAEDRREHKRRYARKMRAVLNARKRVRPAGVFDQLLQRSS